MSEGVVPPGQQSEGTYVGSGELRGVRYRPTSPNEVSRPSRRGYYGLPAIKQPLWHGEIWLYFFLGGLAAGSYLVASLATLFGGPGRRPIARAGYVISFLALLPCPPLLIKDLGRPERFLNMLRIFKPESPMSMGVWGLVGFSAFSSLQFVRWVFGEARGPIGWLARLIPARLLAVGGIPAACFLGTYTGVLLSVTSVPLWARSRLLGATFLASAFSAGVSAITLAVGRRDAETVAPLRRAERAALVGEAAALLGYLRQADRAAHPILSADGYGPAFLGGAVGLGLLVPGLLNLTGRSHGGSGAFLASICALVGGLCLRYSLVMGGHESAKDPDTYFWFTDEPDKG
jgi:formate-dependent nitrite reductase membrane component NrfD